MLAQHDATTMKTKSLNHGHPFPATVISRAERWYFRFHSPLAPGVRRGLRPSVESGAPQAR
jgi:hypothetical protein